MSDCLLPAAAAEAAARLSAAGEGTLYLQNELLDYACGLGTEAYSCGRMHIASFPAAAAAGAEEDYQNWEEAASFLKGLGKEAIMGPEDTIRSLIPFFPEYCVSMRRLMTITPSEEGIREQDQRVRRISSEEDLIALFSLYRRVPGMSEGFGIEDDDDNARAFQEKPAAALFRDGRAVSGAYISRAGHRNAMLSGVATEPGMRGRGYASAVVKAMIGIAFGECGMKRLSLWYTDSNAGRIYRGLGFHDTGTWLCLRRKGEIRQIH